MAFTLSVQTDGPFPNIWPILYLRFLGFSKSRNSVAQEKLCRDRSPLRPTKLSCSSSSKDSNSRKIKAFNRPSLPASSEKKAASINLVKATENENSNFFPRRDVICCRAKQTTARRKLYFASASFAIGNVGQLAVDVLASSMKAQRIGYLDDPFVLTCVGNEAYGPIPCGGLALRLEDYQ